MLEVFVESLCSKLLEKLADSTQTMMTDYRLTVKTLAKDLKVLSARASDVEKVVKNKEQSGRKKRKLEVENWLTEVQQLELEFAELEREMTYEGFIERFFGNLRAQDQAIRLMKRLDKLFEQSHHFGELLVNVSESERVPLSTRRSAGQERGNNFGELPVNDGEYERMPLSARRSAGQELGNNFGELPVNDGEYERMPLSARRSAGHELGNNFGELPVNDGESDRVPLSTRRSAGQELGNNFGELPVNDGESERMALSTWRSVGQECGENLQRSRQLVIRDEGCSRFFDGGDGQRANAVITNFVFYSTDLIPTTEVDYKQTLESLDRSIKFLIRNASDVDEEIKSAELTGKKKRKTTVDLWLGEVKELGSKMEAFKCRLGSESLSSSTIEAEAKKLRKNVQDLIKQSQNFNGLVLDDCNARGLLSTLLGMVFGEKFEDNYDKIIRMRPLLSKTEANISNIGSHKARS